MTGDQLRFIYDNSKISAIELGKMLGISRATLYLKFNLKKVDKNIVDIINSNDRLKRLRQLSENGGKNEEESTISEDKVKLEVAKARIAHLEEVIEIYKEQINDYKKDKNLTSVRKTKG